MTVLVCEVNRSNSIPYYGWGKHVLLEGSRGARGMERSIEQAQIRPPFRIMPSRPQNFLVPGALALFGLVLFAGGIWSASARTHGDVLTPIAMVVGVFLAPIGLLWFLRERRYFDPRNAYWMEIGVDDFALLTPDASDRTAWSNLSPFEVEQTTTRRKTKSGSYESMSYSTVAKYDGLQIKIPLRDFATDLGPTEMARAHAMCAVLNKLRTSALNQQHADVPVPFQVPQGLVVAPMPKPAKMPLIVSNSVVRRM